MRRAELNARQTWVNPLPEEFTTSYQLGNYSEDRIQQIMWKYLVRSHNCERAWARINHHLPETLVSPKPLDILEFSTAHGAMLEIWRNHGHRCVGTDFAWTTNDPSVKHKGVRKNWHTSLLGDLSSNLHPHACAPEVPGWPYQPIIESLDLDVRLFDGGDLPYPFEDNSFDVVCCYQAIEAYAHPSRWLDVVREFCRIARNTVVIGFNPLPVEHAEDEVYNAAAHAAWMKMQNFSEAGFKSVFFELGQTRRGLHPVTCKLVATI